MISRSIAASLLVLVLAGLTVVHAQEPTVVAISDEVALGSRDSLIIRVWGGHVVSINYSTPPNVFIRVEEAFNQDFRSVITLTMVNSTAYGRCMCEFLFSSARPFNLILVKYVQGGETVELGTYQCSENTVFKLVIPLIPKMDSRSIVGGVSISLNLWSIELWGLAAYVVFVPLFGLTAYLDIRDMKAKKAGKWSINDSVALVLRYMFYASVISFVVTALVSFGVFVYSLLTTSLIDFKLGSFMFSLITLISLAVMYGVARWRGWYELIDEED